MNYSLKILSFNCHLKEIDMNYLEQIAAPVLTQ